MIMNKVTLLLSLSLAAITLSCTKANDPYDPHTPGGPVYDVKVKLVPTGDFALVNAKSGEVTPALDQFNLKILNKADGSQYKLYDKFSEVPDILTLPAGSYVLESANGALKSAAFDAPYYSGRTEFAVDISKLTEVQLMCQLANVKVSVAFSEAFGTLVRDGVAIVSNYASDGALSYAPGETRSGYFSVPTANKMQIEVRGFRVADGGEVNKTFFISEVQARQWHKVTVDYTTSGSASQDISIDISTIDKPTDVVVPDGDDVIDGGGNNGNWEDNPDPTPEPDPTPDPVNTVKIEGVGFSIDEPLVITDEQADNAVAVDVTLSADEGIKELWVSINSPSLPQADLDNLGIPALFDMANLDAYPGLEDALRLVGLIGNEPLAGKTSYTFSVGSFTSMFASPNDHKFTIRLVDSKGGELSKDLVIRRIAQ